MSHSTLTTPPASAAQIEPAAEQRPPTATTVLICERDRLVGEFAARYLRTTGGLDTVFVARTLDEATGAAREHEPDVVVIGTTEPGANPELLDQRIRHESPNSKFVMFAENIDYASVSHAVKSGYAGIVCRRTGRPEELVVAVRAAAHRTSHFTHEALSMLSEAPPQPVKVNAVLSTRERQVLELLLASKSTSEIAVDMFISQHTVRNHVRHILTKLQARTKLEAVVRAVQSGLISLEATA